MYKSLKMLSWWVFLTKYTEKPPKIPCLRRHFSLKSSNRFLCPQMSGLSNFRVFCQPTDGGRRNEIGSDTALMQIITCYRSSKHSCVQYSSTKLTFVIRVTINYTFGPFKKSICVGHPTCPGDRECTSSTHRCADYCGYGSQFVSEATTQMIAGRKNKICCVQYLWRCD